MDRKILVVNMNYMGDALLTTPALSALRQTFPDAQIDTIAGAGAPTEVLRGNPDLDRVISREANESMARIGELYRLLRRERYSEVIILPPLPAYAIAATLARTSSRVGQANRGMNLLLTKKMTTRAVHMADAMLETMPVAPEARLHRRLSVALSERDRADAAGMLLEARLNNKHPLVAVNLGATRPQKRWLAEHFASFVDLLDDASCVLIGAGEDDKALASPVLEMSKSASTINLVGRTNIKQLAALLERCDVLLTSDSGSMHLATAVGTPCVALFGSTDPAVTGPYDQRSRVLYKNLACAPCFNHPTCNGRFDCMREITPLEAALAVRDLLREQRAASVSLPVVGERHSVASKALLTSATRRADSAPRILIVTKFRFIGDTLLAIPIFRAARAKWPSGRLTLLTGRNARVLLQNNPYLDEIIEFDPNQRDRGIRPFAQLIKRLRRDRFDYGLTLNRSFHSAVIPWLAGIKIRAGFCSEGRSFLLNRRVSYEYDGDQSEIACYFEVLRTIVPDVPVQPNLELWVTPGEARLAEQQLKAALSEANAGRLIGIQPGASLPEKRWPVARFAKVAEAMVAADPMARIVLIGGPDERTSGDAMWACLSPEARAISADFIGKLDLRGSLAQVSSLSLFLGNDTAVMHSAVALGVPTVALFGPTNPRKWGNYGDGHRVLEAPDGVMSSIPTANVIEAVRSLRAQHPNPTGIITAT